MEKLDAKKIASKNVAKNIQRKESKKAKQRKLAAEMAGEKQPARRAVLIGCSYPGTKNCLGSSFDDIHLMTIMLTDEYAFKLKDIVVLFDSDIGLVSKNSTYANILTDISSLIQNSSSEDILFIYFTGHGDHIKDENGSFISIFLPTDGSEYHNHISGEQLLEIINKAPEGCQITLVLDCCFSGGFVDCALTKTMSPSLTLITSSTHCQTSKIEKDHMSSYFTNALCEAVDAAHGKLTTAQVLRIIHEKNQSKGLIQRAQLYCSSRDDNVFLIGGNLEG